MSNQAYYVNCGHGNIFITPDGKGNVTISQKRMNGSYGEIVLSVDEMERLAKGIFAKRRDVVPTIQEPTTLPPQKQKAQKAYTLEQKRNEQGQDAYKPWTKEDDKNLKELYEKGLTIEQLAKHFHRSKGAIESRINKVIAK